MRLHSVIDAPFPIVCRYLSQEKRYKEYNSLLVDQKDVEELTPHSKICWSQSKKLLFIEPRDFVTFCSHRWLRDGTQLVVSQACDHPDYPLNEGFRAYSLRAATYIMPDDSSSGSKTKIIMLAHCNCGKDLPEWAIRSAVKLLAPIKPFEIIHRINVGIAASRKELEAEEEANAMKMKKSSSRLRKKKNSKKLGRSRSSRPAGIAQMGYGCFWPNGGGKIER